MISNTAMNVMRLGTSIRLFFMSKHAGLIRETRVEAFAETLNVNFLGLVHSVKVALPSMVSRGKGRILLISSAAANVRKYLLSVSW
jgi:short-subunit dehydrogenase